MTPENTSELTELRQQTMVKSIEKWTRYRSGAGTDDDEIDESTELHLQLECVLLSSAEI